MNKPSRYWTHLKQIIDSPEKKATFETEYPYRLKRAISKRKDLADLPGRLIYKVDAIPDTNPLKYKVHVVLESGV